MKWIYHPKFPEDLSEAALYLEQQEPGLGKRLIEAVEKACRKAQQRPEGYSFIDEPVRRVLATPFKFAVHYEYLPDRETLYFHGVFHGAMNPALWRERYQDAPDDDPA